MLQEVLERVSFFGMLYRIDVGFYEKMRSGGCVICGGSLYNGFYERKARGSPVEIPEEYEKRMSMYCGRCGKRHLPQSCLYMGRRVYWGAVLLLVVTLRQQRLTGFSAEKIREQYQISPSTLRRWMLYYREEFIHTAGWKYICGRLQAQVVSAEQPCALVAYFVVSIGDETDGVVSCLEFLAGGQGHGL